MNNLHDESNNWSTNGETVLVLPSPEKPTVSKKLAIHLAETHFDLHVWEIIEFKSYGDKNFYLKTAPASTDCDVQGRHNSEFVLKILNYTDSAVEGMVKAQNDAMIFLREKGFVCSVPVLSSSGSYIVYCNCSKPENIPVEDGKTEDTGKLNAVRLMKYIPGDILRDVPVLTPDLLFDLGQYIGKLDKMLKGYTNPRLKEQIYSWDLMHLNKLKPYISAKYLGCKERESLVMKVYDQYISTIPPVLQKCKKQVIHNDINENNVIVTKSLSDTSTDTNWRIAGIIDFGDICHSYRVFEIANTMCHIITLNNSIGNKDSFVSAGKVLQGYQSVYPLSREELGIIYWCIAGRFIQIVTFSSMKKSIDPENKYVNDLIGKVWQVFPKYVEVADKELLDSWMRE